MSDSSPRWRRFLVPATVAAVASAAVTALAFWGVEKVRQHNPPVTAAALVEVQDKWAGGSAELIEYNDPKYLATRTESSCQDHGCKVAGTEMHSGVFLPVTCHVVGPKVYNYNVDGPYQQNPNRASSTLWYRGAFPDGRMGYISEVWVVAADRGGLGLPDCTP